MTSAIVVGACAITPIAKAQQPLSLQPGEVAVVTFIPPHFVTAVGGGGRTTDVLHTDATQAQGWEKFRLWLDPTRIHPRDGSPAFVRYAIQTSAGNFLTAVDGGGRTTDVLHTDATQARSWEKFHLSLVAAFNLFGLYTIQTLTENYLTALGGGGHTDPAFHTDATTVGNWERFYLVKCGDLGSGFQYYIGAERGTAISAPGGGGQTTGALVPYASDTAAAWALFTLVRQSDGSFAIQTLNMNFVTALGGGGKVPTRQGDGSYSDVFHTDAVQVQAWEKFTLIDQGDCSYAIQTVSGNFVGVYHPDADPNLSTLLFRTDLTAPAKFTLAPILSFPPRSTQ